MCEAPTRLTPQVAENLRCSWILYTKSNGKDRLTVTESKPMLVDSRTDAATLLADDDSLTQLLDPELQPEPPIPGNALSEAIYREHQLLGNEHLRVVTELVYAQDCKEKILMQMDPTERKQKQEMLKKMNEKEELLELYNNLKQQLEKLRSEHVANVLQGQHLTYPNTNVMQQRNTHNSDQTSPQQETEAEDGWVVVSSPSNS